MTSTTTADTRIARLFGLTGEGRERHANPWSVWTRFAVLPLLAVAVWSRFWIGWWSVLVAAVVLVFMVVDPLLFPPPRSTRNWASRGVFGERLWAQRTTRTLPGQFATSRVPTVTAVCQLVALAVLVVGLVQLDLLLTISGLLFCQCAEAWYIDRAMLLFEDVKTRDPAVAAWEHPTATPSRPS